MGDVLNQYDRIRDAVDRTSDAQVAWLSQLVKFRSVRGAEQDCQNWLAAEFRQRGWAVDWFTLADVEFGALPGAAPLMEVDPTKSVQVIARLPHSGRAKGKSLILQGHVDVVPEGPAELWQRAPFSGDIAEGWLHGRGAQDMKMGIAAMVFALDAIAKAGFAPASPVFVQTVTEEESTGMGALATLARGCRADACLIPEPTANTITRAQTGVVWFRVQVTGKPVHAARSQTGSNAIVSTFGVIQALADLAADLNAKSKRDPLFSSLSNPVNFNVGKIRGGDWASSTPAWCEIDCRIGLLPGEEIETLKEAIQAAVRSAAIRDLFLQTAPPRIIWNGFLAEGAVLAPGSEAEAALRASHRKVFGADMEERVSTAVNDTRFYGPYFGITSLCYGPAGKGMHGVNERANLESLKKTTLVLADFIANWCGLQRL